jgi:hypothetical protein
MVIDKNKVILYVLIFCLFYICSEGSWIMSDSLKINKYFMLCIFGLVFTGLTYLINNSNLLNKFQKDNFHFQLTPEKMCSGGAYMYTSDPVKQKLCNSFPPGDLAKYECSPGFHGKPVWWERSDESNANWANTMCDSGLNDFEPHVL